MNRKSELIEELMMLEAREKEIVKVVEPKDVLGAIGKYRGRTQEHFIVITLNGAHAIIKVRVVCKGLINRVLIHPREVFRVAIKDNAAAVILVHNHPSGDCMPSQEDIEVTNRLKSAGKIIGIEVLDHVIIAKFGYYSFSEEGRCF